MMASQVLPATTSVGRTSERTGEEPSKRRTVNRGTVFSLISQADLLTGHEVGALIVNDTVVNNGQLVPVLNEDRRLNGVDTRR